MPFNISQAIAPRLMSSLISPQSGIEFQNMILKGDARCAALFTGGHDAVDDPTTGFPDEGFILSTGKAVDLYYKDNTTTASTNFGSPGDNNFFPPFSCSGCNAHDACTLEFEFKCANSNNDYLDIGYVFGSSHYETSLLEDRFALLLNDNNIATLPGLPSTDVSMSTVNRFENSQFYVTNTFPLVQADGFTKKLTASGPTFSEWNTMKMSVIDVYTPDNDSWVVLEKGGFQCMANSTKKQVNIIQANEVQLMSSFIPPESGIEYQNVKLEGDERCAALFTGGHTVVNDTSTGFPDEGFVLSTGKAVCLYKQDTPHTSTDFGTPGDPDLSQPDSGLHSVDACALEFEFKCENSGIGDLDIDYVFGYDHYQEFYDSIYQDKFAVLLNGANIATLPGSPSTEVSISTVNHIVNSEFYISNDPGTVQVLDDDCEDHHSANVPFPLIEADGFTKSLTAWGPIESGWNTIKMGVTDARDGWYDSWLVLKRGAFECKGAPTIVIVGNTGGDPHFRTFDNKFFSYHGQCDMILTRSKSFASSLGLHVHIRTTRVDNPNSQYSYISAAAVKIGLDILEVSEDGNIIINGKPHDPTTGTTFAGLFSLTKTHKGSKKRIIAYTLDLGDNRIIEIRVNKKSSMLFVDVYGSFADSEGLLGAAPENAKPLLARDGKTDLTGHWNTYGEDWQVNDTDPKLFQDKDRHPQFPEICSYKAQGRSLSHLRRRRLVDMLEVSLEDAEGACAHAKDKTKREFCLDDVMATGDLELAEDPFYMGL